VPKLFRHYKFGFVVGSWLLGAALLIAVIAGFLIYADHSALEQERFANVRMRMNQGAAEMISELQSVTSDWGQWDEAYQFLAGGHDDWADANITAGNLASVGVDAMAIFDQDLKCRFGVVMREDAPEFMPGGGETFCRQIIPYLAGKRGETVLQNHVVLLPGREALVAALAPITHTDGTGPIVGYIVGASSVNNKLQTEIGGNDHLVEIIRRDRPEDVVEYEAAKALLNGPAKGIRNLSLSESVLYGSFGTDSMSDGVLLKAIIPRDEYLTGLRGIAVSLLALLALACLAAFFSVLSVTRLIFRPLRDMAAAVERVTKGEGHASEIIAGGDDDLGTLAQTVRTMVTRLEESRHEAEGLAYDLQKFRLAVENATDMIVIADADFDVIFASRSANGVSGYNERELVGKGALLLWSYQDEKLREAMRQELSAGRPWHGEVQCRRKNGDRYVADLNIAPVMDKHGQLAFSVSIQRDITQAKEVDRMKSEFVSVASHQLKTPLTGIKWFTETLMQDDSSFTKEQKEFMHQLYEMNERMIRLVNDLLNVSRIESGHKFSIVKTLTDLVPVAKHAVAEQGVIAGKRGIKLTLETTAETMLTLVDEEKISQALHNLLNNAIKYSPDGGEVQISLSEDKDGLVVKVADHGLGIPERLQSRIFEKFFRADNVGTIEGTGLGLYIVKAIVEGHGGRISFTSKENSGTTFTFVLPRQDNLPPAI
jgi:two-component system phosphate regulon sensor histidine kinase PhoR